MYGLAIHARLGKHGKPVAHIACFIRPLPLQNVEAITDIILFKITLL